MVERVSGVSLNEYMQTNIFEPLGLKHINMFPTTEMKATLMQLNQRRPNGNLVSRPHILGRPLRVETDAQIKDVANSGGAGCFSRPTDYVQIIATLLNNGTSPKTGKQILKAETVEKMFQNQIPEHPDFAREGLDDAIPELTNKAGELYPQPKEQEQGWGKSCLLGSIVHACEGVDI